MKRAAEREEVGDVRKNGKEDGAAQILKGLFNVTDVADRFLMLV